MERRIAWADSILDTMESGIDVSQIDDRLAMTPEQRLESLQSFLAFLDELRCAGKSTPK